MKEKNSLKPDLEWMEILVLISLLFFMVFTYSYIEPWVYSVWPEEIGMVASYSLPKLTFEFINVCILSGLFSIIAGVLSGLFCFTSFGKDFRTIIEKLSMIIRTIPTMALLLFFITISGTGIKSAIFVLVIQSILPITFAVISGLDNIPKSYIEAARGLGMTHLQLLFKVMLPMALPVIISGIRIAIIICIGAATLAFNTGAGGLGLLIQTGLSTYNTIFIIEGTIPICLIAIISDKFLLKIEKTISRNRR
mgnify:FL=1